jgi:hypothetical protein
MEKLDTVEEVIACHFSLNSFIHVPASETLAVDTTLLTTK